MAEYWRILYYFNSIRPYAFGPRLNAAPARYVMEAGRVYIVRYKKDYYYQTRCENDIEQQHWSFMQFTQKGNNETTYKHSSYTGNT